MDKYLAKAGDFLEKYVQFIVLGLAGLVLLWVVWTYVIDSGVTSAELGNERLGPGEVDNRVLQGPGRSLERAIASGATPITGGIPLPTDGDGAAGQAYPAVAVLAIPRTFSPPAERIEETNSDSLIRDLPTPPPVTIVRAESGKAYADVPGEGLSDVVYVAVRWELPMSELSAAFASVLPQRFSQTSLLDVRLVRERELPTGEFGERTEVARLRNVQWQTLVDESASLDEKRQFLQFARSQAGYIALPPFYPISVGDQPLAVVADPVEEEPVEVAQDERPVMPGGVRRDPRQPAGGPGQPGQQPGRPGGYPGGQGGYPGQQGGYPGQAGGYPGQAGGMGGYGEFGGFDEFGGMGGYPGMDGMGGYPGMDGMGGMGGMDPMGGMGMNGPQGPVPVWTPLPVPSEFNPAMIDGDAILNGIAYDETAEPGETYRYNVVYSLSNPIFDIANVAGEPSLEQQLALASPSQGEAWAAEWSEPVVVDPIVRYFMRSVGTTDGNGRTRDARFTVFRWQNGVWHDETFKVEPGQPLGEVVDGVDYTTGQFLVDIRQDLNGDSPNERVALLSSTGGALVAHRPDEDDSEEYQEFEQLAAQANGPVAVGR